MYDSSINAANLGMYFQDYNFAMSISGILIGAIFLVTTLFLVSK